MMPTIISAVTAQTQCITTHSKLHQEFYMQKGFIFIVL